MSTRESWTLSLARYLHVSASAQTSKMELEAVKARICMCISVGRSGNVTTVLMVAVAAVALLGEVMVREISGHGPERI